MSGSDTEMPRSAAISLDEMRDVARDVAGGSPAGASLSALDIALIRFGLAVSMTSLDRDAIAEAIVQAVCDGATIDQLQEVLSLVSGLGVHSLMAASVPLAQARGDAERPLTPSEAELWQRYVGDDPFWSGFEQEVPGFLGAMLRLSSDQFVAFFDYCAVPWKSGHVRARQKELIAMACDATPAHRFLPGFRLHLRNALSLGVSPNQIFEMLDLAASAPAHVGTR